MWEHDATEVAYKNGYEKGQLDTAKEICEAADELINTICVVTGIELTAVGGKYLELRNKYSGEDINVPTKEDKKTCEGCCNIAFRYPYASMYPCINCVRANQKDYYNIPLED